MASAESRETEETQERNKQKQSNAPTAPPVTQPSELKLPETVTLAWMFSHVPASLWWSLGGVILTAFLLGVAAGQTTFVRELLGKEPKPPVTERRGIADIDKTPVKTSATPAVNLSSEEAAIQVWVNTDPQSNIYHCPGTKSYGKTKAGKYMSQVEAQQKGYQPAYGKVCR